ncbi:MAG: tetratricopeptide repeat protein [Candidatus Micrarchaeia archaeon]
MEDVALYNPDDTIEGIAKLQIPYVEREELLVEPSDKVAVVGRKGSGKTVGILKLVENVKFRKLVIYHDITHETLDRVVERLRPEPLVLIWDNANPVLLSEAIDRISNVVPKLSVIVSCEYEIPGFKNIKLKDLTEGQIKQFVEYYANAMNVSIADDAKEALVEHLKKDPTPFFVYSVMVMFRESEITREAILRLPKNAEGIWKIEFEKLTEAEANIIRTIKYLRHGHCALSAKLIEIMNWALFGSFSAEALLSVKEKGWIYDVGDEYEVHEAQIDFVELPDKHVYMLKLDDDVAIQVLYHFGVAELGRNFEEAIRIFTKAIEIDPSPMLFNMRGIAYMGNGEHASALSDFTKSINMKPTSSAYANRGVLYFIRSEFEKAEEDFKKAIELDARNWKAYVNLGLVYLARKDYKSAVGAFTDSLGVVENIPAYTNRGIAFMNMGDYMSAIADFRKLVAIDPSEISYGLLGLAYLRMDELDMAIRNLTISIEIKPTIEAYTNRGSAYFKKLDYEKAQEDYRMALSLDPENAEALANVGMMALIRNQYEEAIESFTRSLEKLETPTAFYNRALAYMAVGERRSAIADLTRALLLEPENPQYYAMRGVARFEAGEYNDAVFDFTRAIGLEPQNISLYHARGVAFFESGNYDRAIEDFTKSLELGPNVAAYTLRGLAYTMNGEYDLAIKDLDKSIAMEPTAVAFSNRALSFLAIEEYELAIEDATKAISLEPNNPKPYNVRGLARIYKQDYNNGAKDLLEAAYLFLFNGQMENAIECLSDAYYTQVSKDNRIIQEECGIMLVASTYITGNEIDSAIVEEAKQYVGQLSLPLKLLLQMLNSINTGEGISMEAFGINERELCAKYIELFDTRTWTPDAEDILDEVEDTHEMVIWWLILNVIKKKADEGAIG